MEKIDNLDSEYETNADNVPNKLYNMIINSSKMPLMDIYYHLDAIVGVWKNYTSSLNDK